MQSTSIIAKLAGEHLRVASRATADALRAGAAAGFCGRLPRRRIGYGVRLCLALLASLLIHLGATAVSQLLLRHSASLPAEDGQSASGFQYVATIQLGTVDAVVFSAPAKAATVNNPTPAQPEAEAAIADPPRPFDVAKAEPQPAPSATASQPSAVAPPSSVSAPVASAATASGDTDAEPPAWNDEPTPASPAPGSNEPGMVALAQADYLHNPPPRYPELARQRGWQGVTMLRVRVRADGTPEEVELLKTSGYRTLDDASVETVRGWRFIPARRGGQAVNCWVQVPIRFQLTGS